MTYPGSDPVVLRSGVDGADGTACSLVKVAAMMTLVCPDGIGHLNRIYRQPLDGAPALLFEADDAMGTLTQAIAVSRSEVFAVTNIDPWSGGMGAYLAIPKSGEP